MGKILDIIEITGKTVVSAIPVGGALISATFDSVKNNCLAKRQQEWAKAIEKRIGKLECSLDDLGASEQFTSALIKGTEIALKTANKDKVAFLANAVINSFRQSIEEEKLIIFFDLIDKYTVSHIKIVNFFNNPKKFETTKTASYYIGAPSDLLFLAYPELENPLFNKIYRDLYLDGIVNTESLNVSMTANGMEAKRTTALGDEFLDFILSDFIE